MRSSLVQPDGWFPGVVQSIGKKNVTHEVERRRTLIEKTYANDQELRLALWLGERHDELAGGVPAGECAPNRPKGRRQRRA
jgi:hypothetical protein